MQFEGEGSEREREALEQYEFGRPIEPEVRVEVAVTGEFEAFLAGYEAGTSAIEGETAIELLVRWLVKTDRIAV